MNTGKAYKDQFENGFMLGKIVNQFSLGKTSLIVDDRFHIFFLRRTRKWHILGVEPSISCVHCNENDLNSILFLLNEFSSEEMCENGILVDTRFRMIKTFFGVFLLEKKSETYFRCNKKKLIEACIAILTKFKLNPRSNEYYADPESVAQINISSLVSKSPIGLPIK